MQRVGGFQHASAGLVLLEAGINQLRRHPGEDLTIAWFSVASGGVLVLAVLWEWWQARRHRRSSGHAPAHAAHHAAGGINWMDLIAIPSLIAEGWHKMHRGAHYLPYVYVGLAVITLLRGLLLDRLAGGRVEIDSDRLFIRTSPFRARSTRWADVANVACGASGVTLTLTGGRSAAFDLRDATNREAVLHAVAEAWAEVSAARTPPAAPAAPVVPAVQAVQAVPAVPEMPPAAPTPPEPTRPPAARTPV
jgi:hypothetical protein